MRLTVEDPKDEERVRKMTKTFTLELTKDELTILHYVIPDGRWGDPLKDTYELREDEPEDPYEALRTLSLKVFNLGWEKK